MRSICITGEPVLRHQTKPVTDFSDSLKTLVNDMFETMDAAPGVGLAGPQVGLDKSLFVYGWEDEHGVEHRGAAINPELYISPTLLGPLTDAEDEGCLSVPGERFPLRRANKAVLHAVDVANNPFTIEAEGWLARIFQHEYDHLLGILYTDRLEPAYRRQVDKVIRKQHWGKPGIAWTPGIDDLEG